MKRKLVLDSGIVNNVELTYLEKLMEEIASSYKPNGRLSDEQVFLLCAYKREVARLNVNEIYTTEVNQFKDK